MKKATLLATVVAMAIGLAQPALAASWGPLSSSYNGQVRVTGSGSFGPYLSAYAQSRISVTDKANDGNTVYGTTSFQFYEVPIGSSSPTWVSDRSLSTPEHSGSGVTKTTYLKRSLHSRADRARGITKVCAQMGWPVPDSCSASAYNTFSY